VISVQGTFRMAWTVARSMLPLKALAGIAELGMAKQSRTRIQQVFMAQSPVESSAKARRTPVERQQTGYFFRQLA
jgi:hypothetical protein